MSPGRHAATDTSFARSAGGAATRGIILIVVAVVIGVVLIANGVDDDDPVAAPATSAVPPATAAPSQDTTPDTTSQPDDTTAPVPDDTAAPPETTTPDTNTTEPVVAVFTARPANIVSVQVVNTTKVGGAAGRLTGNLAAQGYDTLDAATESSGAQTETRILHIDGYLLEAQAIAELLLLDPDSSVDSMPSNPGATIDNFLEPQVLVLLGSDLAG